MRLSTMSGRALCSLIGLIFLLAPTMVWSRTADALPRYEMRVKVLPHALSVGMDMTLPMTVQSRKSLQFKLLPSMGTPEVRLGNSPAADALKVRKIGEDSDKLKPRTTWEIDPVTPFPAGQPISLSITYSGGAGGALVYYVGPEIIIASGIVQPWFPQFSDDKVIGTLHVDMPAAFLALAPGEILSDRVRNGRREMDFRMPTPTKIDLVAGPFKIIKAPQKAGELPVSLYLLKDREFAADLVDLVRRSVAALEIEFGPFPVKQFAVVEFPTDPGMAASFSGASVDGYILMRSDDLDRKRADPSDSFFAHEIGHQWWGVSVGSTGAKDGDYMLDEALAEYGRLKVVEALLGPEGAKRFRDEQRNKVLRRIAAGYDGPLSDMPEPTPSQAGFLYQDVSRAKGALVYDIISRGIGPERMRAFFRDVQSTYGYSSRLTWQDFHTRLKQAAGPDHQWLVDQWLDQPGLPVVDFKWTAGNGMVALDIVQRQKGTPTYRFSAPVNIVYSDGSAGLNIVEVGAQAETKVDLPTTKLVVRVEFDPLRTIPWVTPQEFAAAVALKNFTLAWQLWNYEGRTQPAEQILKDGLETRKEPDSTPAEFLERYEYGWILEGAGKMPEALAQYKRAIELPVRPEGQDSVHLIQDYVNLARAASKTGDKPLSRWAAQAARVLLNARTEDAYTRRTRPEVETYLDTVRR